MAHCVYPDGREAPLAYFVGGPLDGEMKAVESDTFYVPIRPAPSISGDISPDELGPVRRHTYRIDRKLRVGSCLVYRYEAI